MIKVKAIEINMGTRKPTMCVVVQADSEYLLVLGWPSYAKTEMMIPNPSTWSAYQENSTGVLCDWWHEVEAWQNDRALIDAWLTQPANRAQVSEIAGKLIRAGYR